MQAPFFLFCSFTSHQGDFPGGPVVKNLPADAGDKGLDFTCCGATKPGCTTTIEPTCCNY